MRKREWLGENRPRYIGCALYGLYIHWCMKWDASITVVCHVTLLYTLSYYHHQIGSMNYYPLFRVRSWNNGVRCISFYILIDIKVRAFWSFPVWFTWFVWMGFTCHGNSHISGYDKGNGKCLGSLKLILEFKLHLPFPLRRYHVEVTIYTYSLLTIKSNEWKRNCECF